MKTTKLLMAIAVTAIALPVAAQAPAEKPMPSEMKGQETPVKKKTPEEIAKDKATAERVRAEANKPGPKAEAAKDGQQLTPAKKKTPEQLAKEKADKEKRGSTPEADAAAKKSGG